ncbi:uncharacterized protein N7506_008398, partial [Penicillium brevicompactum]|uniref:uncharacterized protein n=1 Tax=Penicillium brevicompactum TaxID=5074 RepID=UPI002540576E
MLNRLIHDEPWGAQWRSSMYFVVATMAVALLTDMYLYGFLVPLLPYVLEHRLGLDEALTQRFSTALLSQNALIMVVASPFIGSHADRSGAKRAWLLSGLGGALLGSLVIALATSVFTLFAGRLIQSFASTSVWVVGFSTLADHVPANQIGRMYGFVTVAVAIGTSAGPLVSGVLFDLGGYWVAWSSVLFIVIVDVIMRCLMIDNTARDRAAHIKSDEEESERQTLLSPSTDSEEEQTSRTEKTGIHFYKTLLSNGRFIGGIACYLCFAILTASFDATLPLHRAHRLAEGSSGYTIPDHDWLCAARTFVVGDRDPGDERFPWASAGKFGPTMYSVAVCGAGVVICLLNGVGMMEATQAVDEIQGRSPGIFGRNGGYSRAISLVSMSWTAGMFIGPILAGYGVEQIGYYGMNCVL